MFVYWLIHIFSKFGAWIDFALPEVLLVQSMTFNKIQDADLPPL